jgi:hypothetical protein
VHASARLLTLNDACAAGAEFADRRGITRPRDDAADLKIQHEVKVMDATSPEKGRPHPAALWTPKTEELLRDWRNRAYAAQSAYYVVAGRYRRANYALGIPVVILSGLVGTAVFAKLQTSMPNGHWLIGSVSILAAVLSSLQTFLRLADNAAEHGAAAAWYSAIRRDTEQVLALPCESRGGPKACLDTIRKDMNKAGQKAPPLNERLWSKYAQRFKVNEPPWRRGAAAVANAAAGVEAVAAKS